MPNPRNVWPLFESIRLKDGVFSLLFLHQNRVNHARKTLLKLHEELSLEDWLQQWPVPQHGLYKCRLNYGKTIDQPAYIPYVQKPIKSLRLVHSNSIEYSFKRNNRSPIEKLYQQRGACDDVLMVRDGLITDTSYCNIIFCMGGKWQTPQQPLLQGVQRQWLLNNGIISQAKITVDMIPQFDTFKLVNAMIPFEEAKEIPVAAIIG